MPKALVGVSNHLVGLVKRSLRRSDETLEGQTLGGPPLKTRSFVVACALLALYLPQPAVQADTVSISDPQGDNSGTNRSDEPVTGRLDIAKLTQEHQPPSPSREHELLVHRVTTYDEWSNDLISSGDVFLDLSFESAKGQTGVSIGVNEDGTLYGRASFYNYRRQESAARGFARVWRPDSRTLVVALWRDQIWPGHANELTNYTWRAHSTDRDCSNVSGGDAIIACNDYGPDDGFLHVIEGPGSLDCRDGVDNDDDGSSDFPEDTGCISAEDYYEGLTEEECDEPCDPPTLTIKKRSDSLSGYMRSPHETCQTDRTVFLYRKRSGPDRWVMRIGLDPQGRWGMDGPARPGRYYAAVLPEIKYPIGEQVKCSAVASRTVRFLSL